MTCVLEEFELTNLCGLNMRKLETFPRWPHLTASTIHETTKRMTGFGCCCWYTSIIFVPAASARVRSRGHLFYLITITAFLSPAPPRGLMRWCSKCATFSRSWCSPRCSGIHHQRAVARSIYIYEVYPRAIRELQSTVWTSALLLAVFAICEFWSLGDKRMNSYTPLLINFYNGFFKWKIYNQRLKPRFKGELEAVEREISSK